MVFAVLVALAFVGCYHGDPPQGAPCTPTAPVCPTGQSCAQKAGAWVCSTADVVGPDARIDGRPDADPNSLDDDGDGIANGIDNCRTKANPTQTNEDADDFGDVCDLCPPYADNTDSDGDGVGDQCDPNPTTGGDELVLFEGFDGPMPAGWTTTGLYTTSAGSLSSSVSGGSQNTLVTPVTTSSRQTMYAQMTLTAIEPGQTGGALGIVDRFDSGATQGVMCGGVRGNGGFLGIVNAATGTAIQIAGHAFAVGTPYTLKFTRSENNYSCVDTATGTTVNAAAGPNGTFIGLRNRVASASYAWLMVVHSP
jgi:hypothetical protein